MILKIDNVNKMFGKFQALTDFSFEFEPGIYGLLGQNGAGKSTLMNLIAGVTTPTRGEVFLDGKKIKELGKEYRKQLGYLPQISGYYKNFTAFEYLRYVALLKGMKNSDEIKHDIEDLLEKVNMSKFSKKKLGGFSGGMRQRIGIAQALIGNPGLLIFDEPTAGLDPKERIRFRNLLAELSKDKIIIVATHIVSDIEMIADQILILKEGNLIESGTIEKCLEELNGKVFEINVNQEELSAFTQNHRIVGMNRVNSVVTNVRYIEDGSAGEDSVKVKPSLEDLYMYYFEV